MDQGAVQRAAQIGCVSDSDLMSKRTLTRLALLIAALLAVLAAFPAFAQPLHTSVVLEGGGPGLMYGLGIEQELVRTPSLHLGVRGGGSAFPVVIGTGVIRTLFGQLVAEVRPGEGRFGVESAVGLTALATRRVAVFTSAPLDTLVTARTVGLAIRVPPAPGSRLGGRAGVTAILFRDRWGAVFLPTLSATWRLAPPPTLDASSSNPPRAEA